MITIKDQPPKLGDVTVLTSLGINLGSSTISIVEIQQQDSKKQIVNTTKKSHLGDVRGCLLELLKQQNDIANKRICVTGRKLRHSLHLSAISEPEAIELSVRHILPPDHPFRVVISAGGETFMLYHLNELGEIQNIQTGN